MCKYFLINLILINFINLIYYINNRRLADDLFIKLYISNVGILLVFIIHEYFGIIALYISVPAVMEISRNIIQEEKTFLFIIRLWNILVLISFFIEQENTTSFRIPY